MCANCCPTDDTYTMATTMIQTKPPPREVIDLTLTDSDNDNSKSSCNTVKLALTAPVNATNQSLSKKHPSKRKTGSKSDTGGLGSTNWTSKENPLLNNQASRPLEPIIQTKDEYNTVALVVPTTEPTMRRYHSQLPTSNNRTSPIQDSISLPSPSSPLSDDLFFIDTTPTILPPALLPVRPMNEPSSGREPPSKTSSSKLLLPAHVAVIGDLPVEIMSAPEMGVDGDEDYIDYLDYDDRKVSTDALGVRYKLTVLYV